MAGSPHKVAKNQSTDDTAFSSSQRNKRGFLTSSLTDVPSMNRIGSMSKIQNSKGPMGSPLARKESNSSHKFSRNSSMTAISKLKSNSAPEIPGFSSSELHPKEFILQKIEKGEFQLVESAGSKTSVDVREKLADGLIQLSSFCPEDTERLFIWACLRAVHIAEHPLELFVKKDFVSYEVLSKMESGVGGRWKKMLAEPVIKFLKKKCSDGDQSKTVMEAAGIFFDSLSDIAVDVPIMVRQAWGQVHKAVTEKWGEERGVPIFLRYLLHEQIQYFVRSPKESGIVNELPESIPQLVLDQVADLIVDVSEQRVHEEDPQLRAFVSKKRASRESIL
eukprot:TRINITY_DN1861_c0_g1_i1.p1 TRINITY_DN1861_c0_g1~~TRINITY_DN1861_c0_g1_i1.p1  ORF type:complete len:334 (-),score=113.69 TRINITY_DN1861_c0_g1_i1:789-1790(-)